MPPEVWGPVWDRETGEGIKIAILDTGYVPHRDLPEPIAAETFVRGESVQDRNGHGTHCAGTALGRNGIGVAPGADLIVGKVLSNGGSGSSTGIAAGIRWAVNVGADVISLSLGGPPFGPTRDAIVAARRAGVLVFAAAGNAGFNGRRNTIGHPARYRPDPLCVGAVRRDGRIAGFSSGGTEMDLAAPGERIVSASIRGGRVEMNGTSMACPGAAGCGALVTARVRATGRPTIAGADAWREFTRPFMEDRGTPGHDPSFGHGVLRTADIINALSGDDTPWL